MLQRMTSLWGAAPSLYIDPQDARHGIWELTGWIGPEAAKAVEDFVKRHGKALEDGGRFSTVVSSSGGDWNSCVRVGKALTSLSYKGVCLRSQSVDYVASGGTWVAAMGRLPENGEVYRAVDAESVWMIHGVQGVNEKRLDDLSCREGQRDQSRFYRSNMRTTGLSGEGVPDFARWTATDLEHCFSPQQVVQELELADMVGVLPDLESVVLRVKARSVPVPPWAQVAVGRSWELR